MGIRPRITVHLVPLSLMRHGTLPQTFFPLHLPNVFKTPREKTLHSQRFRVTGLRLHNALRHPLSNIQLGYKEGNVVILTNSFD